MLPNTNSEAAEGDQPITDEAQVPEQTTGEVSADQEQQKEQPLTLDQVRELIRSEVNPLIQSQVAKSENRTEKRIQERLQALEVNRETLKLSEADYEAAQNNIIREEQMNALKPKGPQGKPTPQTAPDLDEYARYVNDEIDAVVRAANVEITPSDPEFKMIQSALSDPNGNLAATIIAAHTAATTKAARLKALKGNAGARAGVGGGQTSTSSNLSNVTDPKELYKMGERELHKNK